MIYAAGYGNVSDFEILWTIVATVGFLFSVITMGQAWGDLRVLRSQERNRDWLPSWLLAKVWMVTEAGRMFTQLVFAAVGYYSMTVPDPNTVLGGWREVVSAIIRWGFLLAATVTCAKTIYVWYIRRRLRENGTYVIDGDEGG